MKSTITLLDFVEFCSGKKKIRLERREMEAVQASRAVFETLQKSGEVYGSNTGVGPFFREKISPQDVGEFEARLIRSHATGTGEFIDEEEARGVIFLLINMLRKGHSGASSETLGALVNLFNNNVVPVIPCQGSLGASGDLAPLAHLALVLMGEGGVLIDGKAVATRQSPAFREGKVHPIKLKRGEGLAFINGTHFMTSILCLTAYKTEQLIKSADYISALTFQALEANSEAFDEQIHRLRPHPGQLASADNLRKFLESMVEIRSPNLQDGYSLRCVPQVHGVIMETLWFVKGIVEIEINSVTGNPIVVDGRVLHGGNFHGHPLALAADFLSIALATLGVISERRINRIMNPALSAGLPPYLADEPETGDYGMMMKQYTAASLVSENKTLSHPASVDSIPVAGDQEDYVSMGAWAARKAKQILANTGKILAIELSAANRALELRGGVSSE